MAKSKRGGDLAQCPPLNTPLAGELTFFFFSANSGHPLYDGLLVTVGILFLFLIATLFMMKYKKKRFCFRSRSSPNNGVNENAQNCKECQGKNFNQL